MYMCEINNMKQSTMISFWNGADKKHYVYASGITSVGTTSKII